MHGHLNVKINLDLLHGSLGITEKNGQRTTYLVPVN